MLDRTISNPFL